MAVTHQLTSEIEPTTDDGQQRAVSVAAPIKFGTDGWRAIIADDFTFDNVRRVAGAIASYVLKSEVPNRGLVVGYDTRFGSPSFARAAAEVLASAVMPVKLSQVDAHTPAVS
jgi:phosphomannomutase